MREFEDVAQVRHTNDGQVNFGHGIRARIGKFPEPCGYRVRLRGLIASSPRLRDETGERGGIDADTEWQTRFLCLCPSVHLADSGRGLCKRVVRYLPRFDNAEDWKVEQPVQWRGELPISLVHPRKQGRVSPFSVAAPQSMVALMGPT